MSKEKLIADMEWLLSHPEMENRSEYHDAAACWQLIDTLRAALNETRGVARECLLVGSAGTMGEAVTAFFALATDHPWLLEKLGA